jgi:hypothetical protein
MDAKVTICRNCDTAVIVSTSDGYCSPQCREKHRIALSCVPCRADFQTKDEASKHMEEKHPEWLSIYQLIKHIQSKQNNKPRAKGTIGYTK